MHTVAQRLASIAQASTSRYQSSLESTVQPIGYYTKVKSAGVRLFLVTLLSVNVLATSWVIITPEPTFVVWLSTFANVFSVELPLEVDDVVIGAGNRKVGDHVMAKDRSERERVRATSPQEEIIACGAGQRLGALAPRITWLLVVTHVTCLIGPDRGNDRTADVPVAKVQAPGSARAYRSGAERR